MISVETNRYHSCKHWRVSVKLSHHMSCDHEVIIGSKAWVRFHVASLLFSSLCSHDNLDDNRLNYFCILWIWSTFALAARILPSPERQLWQGIMGQRYMAVYLSTWSHSFSHLLPVFAASTLSTLTSSPAAHLTLGHRIRLGRDNLPGVFKQLPNLCKARSLQPVIGAHCRNVLLWLKPNCKNYWLTQDLWVLVKYSFVIMETWNYMFIFASGYTQIIVIYSDIQSHVGNYFHSLCNYSPQTVFLQFLREQITMNFAVVN